VAAPRAVPDPDGAPRAGGAGDADVVGRGGAGVGGAAASGFGAAGAAGGVVAGVAEARLDPDGVICRDSGRAGGGGVVADGRAGADGAAGAGAGALAAGAAAAVDVGADGGAAVGAGADAVCVSCCAGLRFMINKNVAPRAITATAATAPITSGSFDPLFAAPAVAAGFGNGAIGGIGTGLVAASARIGRSVIGGGNGGATAAGGGAGATGGATADGGAIGGAG